MNQRLYIAVAKSMSPPCKFYNNCSHQYQPNYITAMLNHLKFKSSLCFWCYNISLLNQLWKRNWSNQYFHLPFKKCWNKPFWHQKANPFLFITFILINQNHNPQRSLTSPYKGEWRGLTASVEDFHSKGRGFESPRRLSLLKNVSCRGNEECIVRGRRRGRRRRRSQTCKTRSRIETCKTRRSREMAKAIESGMATRKAFGSN